jgi:adenylyl cyclase-associated protein
VGGARDETQKNWARSFPALLVALAEYVKKQHTTGLVWNPKGGNAKAASASPAATAAAAPAPAAAAATPAPAPAAAAGGAPTAGLFSALNRGEAVTGGLKKVDKSQMTHKNPELRATSVVQAKEVTSKDLERSKAAGTGTGVPSGPPKLELVGNKWTVEYQKDNKDIQITETENKQVVYVYRCVNTTIVIKGKVNQVRQGSDTPRGRVRVGFRPAPPSDRSRV